MKFLIDECLSPELTRIAREKGHDNASHVVWLGLAGLPDWTLKSIILDGDWTFVTKNSIDFRGARDDPGAKGQYADVPIHAGLVCLNGPPGMGSRHADRAFPSGKRSGTVSRALNYG